MKSQLPLAGVSLVNSIATEYICSLTTKAADFGKKKQCNIAVVLVDVKSGYWVVLR